MSPTAPVLRIGTRGSDLARWQARRVRDLLARERTPVIAYHGSPGEGAPASAAAAVDPTYALGAQVALRLGARKLFLVTPLAGRLRR